jgi:RHS repeat-associated protein
MTLSGRDLRSRRKASGRWFRKARSRREPPQMAGDRRLRKKPRTCFEGPFGEVIRATGPMAKANPFRFSTKYQDEETDLLYYDYRYYSASTGRWLSRDPIQERAFQITVVSHLFSKNNAARLIKRSVTASYQFVYNDPLHRFDRFGLVDGVFWNGSGKCPAGTIVSFAQVGWGGAEIVGADKPFIDNGSKWNDIGTAGPEYQPGSQGYTGFFSDSPDWSGGPTQFVTCMLCTQSCCAGYFRGYSISGHRLVRLGPCKKWQTGDSGDLNTFPDATEADLKIFNDTISAKFSNWKTKCYPVVGAQDSISI